MRIILAGNPNCGKTTLFNALTRSNAKTGNWHGVTVGERCKKTRIAGQEATVCDLPGIYSLLTHSLEERVSKRAIEEEEYDLVVAVADAVTLARSIKLPLEIAARGKKTILVVTMADLLKKRGGYLDAEKLSARLGIPVVTADARSKRDIRRLQQKIAETCGKETPAFSPVREEEALDGVYSAGSEKSGIADFVLYNPVTAYALFALIMLSVFFLAFGNHMPGVFLKDKTEYLIGDVLGGGAVSLLERVGAHPAILSLVKDALFGGAAMLLSFVPQIVIVQAALIVLEESGYMASLAFMTDGIFSKVGLSGRAAFSILMGFGCSAAAILTTRGLEDKKIQKRTVLILPYISWQRENARLSDADLRLFYAQIPRAVRHLLCGRALFAVRRAAVKENLRRRNRIRAGDPALAAAPSFPAFEIVAILRKTVYNENSDRRHRLSHRHVVFALVRLHLSFRGAG